MTADEQPNPDQAGTWEPNYDYLMQAGAPFPWRDERHRFRAVIEEYRRQQAGRGIVEVERDDLETILDAYEDLLAEGFDVADGGQAAKRLYAILAAATGQDR